MSDSPANGKRLQTLPVALVDKVSRTRSRDALHPAAGAQQVLNLHEDGEHMYQNKNDRLQIEFAVERLPFSVCETMDPRILRIAPGRRNELHRHAHETLFVALEGRGEVRLGDTWHPLNRGQIAHVPRWVFHQTRNSSEDEELVILAITDFGFTSAVLGNYDRRTRLARRGQDSKED